jgi:hypothetical protein
MGLTGVLLLVSDENILYRSDIYGIGKHYRKTED